MYYIFVIFEKVSAFNLAKDFLSIYIKFKTTE